MESDGIHIGTNVGTREPVLVPVSLFRQHMAIRGMTGAMKSVWCRYIVLQLIARCRDASFLDGDFGGDRFAFQATRIVAEHLGKRFSFLSTRREDASSSFNPLAIFYPLDESKVVRATHFLATSLSLHHGEGFSKAYWGDISVVTFIDTLTACIHQGIHEPSLLELAEQVEKASRTYRKSEVAQAAMSLRQLMLYPQLAAKADDAEQISMRRVLEQGEAVYGFLPGILEPTSAKIGGMLVWAAVLAAMHRAEEGLPPKEVFIVVDEFPTVAQSRAFEQCLVLARKFHIRLILLYQSEEQLRDGGGGRDLRPIVRDNAAIFLALTSRGGDIDDLQKMSREVPKVTSGGTGISEFKVNTQYREEFVAELDANDIRDASGRSGDGYLVLQTGEGHFEPVRVRFEPMFFKELFTRETHERLSSMQLPQRAASGKPTATLPKPMPIPLTPERRKLHAALAAIITRHREAEHFDAE